MQETLSCHIPLLIPDLALLGLHLLLSILQLAIEFLDSLVLSADSVSELEDQGSESLVPVQNLVRILRRAAAAAAAATATDIDTVAAGDARSPSVPGKLCLCSGQTALL